MTYQSVYDRSMRDPASFWAEAAGLIDWTQPWEKVLDDTHPPFYRWFSGGMLNTCYNAVDRHVAAGRGDQAAIIHDSPVTGTKRTISYAELQDQVARFAGVLSALGVTKGDRVIIYMPMVPEAAIAMLGCARIGAIHSVVFGGFSARELATRIDDAKPKVMVAGSCGIEPNRVVHYKPLLDSAITLAEHKPEHCVILQREQEPGTLIEGRDLGWAEAMAEASAVDCVPVAATDPLYILYTSGTTGQPKGVVRCTAAHRLYHAHLRGQAGRHPRCRGLLASDRRAWRGGPLHRPDRVSRDQARRPGRHPSRALRSGWLQGALPRRRALRSGYTALGRAASPGPGHRPLVADRDRLGDRRQLSRHRAAAGQAGLADPRGARL